MGEVWKAKDTRLDRELAIKVLPPSFADDEQLRQRLEREAAGPGHCDTFHRPLFGCSVMVS
jgi:serine/threonine protein kinase